MQHSQVFLGAVCALTVAGACSGDTDEVLIKNTAGNGGSSSQVGGTGGTGAIGGTGGSAGAGGSPSCEGPAPYNNSGNVFEARQCYVSELTGGEAECLPVNDPTLLDRLQTPINGYGFTTWFVIDVAETVPLPDSCEPLLACCSRIPQNDPRHHWQERCYDSLEHPNTTTQVDGCPIADERPQADQPPRFKEIFDCSDTSEPDAGQSRDAGGDSGTSEQDAAMSPATSSHALCCYSVCRYMHYE